MKRPVCRGMPERSGPVRGVLTLFPMLVFAVIISSGFAENVMGPWRKGDFAQSAGVADDRPDEASFSIVAENYSPILSDVFVKGEKGKLGFRISPRDENWIGLLITTPDGTPVSCPKRSLREYRVEILNPESKDPTNPEQAEFMFYKDKVLFSDASRYFRPKTEIRVYSRDRHNQGELIDKAVVDFTNTVFSDSNIKMSDLVEPDTRRHGFVRPQGSDFVRDDGKRMFLWGGHENHIPAREQADRYAEIYPAAGINVMRHLGHSGMITNAATGEVDPELLDRFFYLVNRLGQSGVYFMMSHTYQYVGERTTARGSVYGYSKENKPPDYDYCSTFLDPKTRAAQKNFWRTVLTTVNPYTGKALKDDPTIIGFELANEHGLCARKFDCNVVRDGKVSDVWTKRFCAFLLKKYGTREKLAEAWHTDPLFPHEDPARNTIMVPSNFRGVRVPYGGTGQHDQFATPKYYKQGLAPEHNPRFLDAIEFNKIIARKKYPFDFNNLATPEETAELRAQFNTFLRAKYGSRAALSKAWAEDRLFAWEDPAKNSILIPSEYRGELSYEQNKDTRIANPRISDAREMMFEIQRNWATDMFTFLRDDIGMNVALGWNGDGFQVIQAPNHLANLLSPGSLCIASGYCDWDNGDQLTSRTKNLKRWTTSYIHGRPTFAYEWGGWSVMGPFQYEYILQAALFGKIYGFDGFAHHKMSALIYPVANPYYSLKVHYITPISERPRRGAFCVARWILERSRIPEIRDKIIVGYPKQSVLTGGPERKMSNAAFENWINYQIGTESYGFEDVYDGPTNRVVIHSGRGPYGDYSAAEHAILWCHSDTDREGNDPDAKKKWFARHGIEFKPGQKYYLDDHYFATTEDMTEYVRVHADAESARWDTLRQNAMAEKKKARGPAVTTANDDYWKAEPNAGPTELDRQLYRALERWEYPLPFAEDEIDKVWRSRDGSIHMDTTQVNLQANRDDMQVWFGKSGKGTKVTLDKLEAATDEHQYAVALLPWDTGDFKTSHTLALWCMWNSEVTVKLPFKKPPEIYAVNWLGKRLFKVKPIKTARDSVTFMTARHDDIFCYEIVR